MHRKQKNKAQAYALRIKKDLQSTARGLSKSSTFCPNPTAQTTAKALSPEQRELLRISREAVSASGDAIGKYRAAAQFIRKKQTRPGKTENRLLVAAGLCKSAASEIVLVAVHASKDVFLKWMIGEIGFRGALKEAKALKVAKANGRPKQRLAKQDRIS